MNEKQRDQLSTLIACALKLSDVPPGEAIITLQPLMKSKRVREAIEWLATVSCGVPR